MFTDDLGHISQWSSIVAGSLAGMVSTIVTYPTDLIKTRLIVQNMLEPSYRGLVHAFSTIYQQEGFLALYRGVTLTILVVLTCLEPLLFSLPNSPSLHVLKPVPSPDGSLFLILVCRCTPVLCWLPSSLHEPGENLEWTPRPVLSPTELCQCLSVCCSKPDPLLSL
uniref:Solute carrier family 25 member 43 n=1 Tax=Castor canadensis TaxID=51338 RepID=A0A8C0WJX0_CASCN